MLDKNHKCWLLTADYRLQLRQRRRRRWQRGLQLTLRCQWGRERRRRRRLEAQMETHGKTQDKSQQQVRESWQEKLTDRKAKIAESPRHVASCSLCSLQFAACNLLPVTGNSTTGIVDVEKQPLKWAKHAVVRPAAAALMYLKDT